MKYLNLREELKKYYYEQSYKNAEKYLCEGTKRFDGEYTENMTPYEAKVLQYKIISDMFEPVIFIMKREYFPAFPTAREIITGISI